MMMILCKSNRGVTSSISGEASKESLYLQHTGLDIFPSYLLILLLRSTRILYSVWLCPCEDYKLCHDKKNVINFFSPPESLDSMTEDNLP